MQRAIVARNRFRRFIWATAASTSLRWSKAHRRWRPGQAAHAPASDDAQTIRAILWRCYMALAEASRRSGGVDGARQAVNWHQRGADARNEQLYPGDAGYRRSTLNARMELANAYAAADEIRVWRSPRQRAILDESDAPAGRGQ